MTGTATLDRLQRMNVAFFERGDNAAFNIGTPNDFGGATVSGIKIFRVGTFRDSMGIQHTWTPEHLEQMVFHFDLLRSQGVLPNVPWRIDHSASALNVAGYFDRLYVEGGFLLADVNFTRPDVVEGMRNGTFRSRSLEVGVYETNDEAFYWPVVTGCAFVDLPAVEGLYSQAQPVHRTVLFGHDTRSAQMFKINGKDVAPEVWEKAANYAQALADAEAVAASEHAAVVAERDKLKSDLETAQQAIAAHGKGAPVEFRVDGQAVSDIVAVQNHITVLETFRTESLKTARESYVKELAAAGKLPATQIESQTAFVHSLTDEQFAAFKKTWDEAPAASLFGIHGTGPGNLDGGNPAGAGGGAPAVSELETLEQTVAMLAKSMKPEQLEKTSSYQRLQTLKSGK